jgi:PhnB protein
MSISLAPYLNFPQGKTREAMTFYQSVFGGKLDISTFGEFHMEGMPSDGVMHAMLTADTFTFMASDARRSSAMTSRR